MRRFINMAKSGRMAAQRRAPGRSAQRTGPVTRTGRAGSRRTKTAGGKGRRSW